MPITTDELFEEDFKPEWMLRHEQYVQESYDYALQAGIDLRWKLAAYAKAHKIASKWRKPDPRLYKA